MLSLGFQPQKAVTSQYTEIDRCAVFAGICMQAVFCDLSPMQSRPFQSLLYIHVVTAVVRDDDVEVWILSDSEQLFHVGDELQHPTCLVFHWLYCKRETIKAKLVSKMVWLLNRQGFLPPLKPH